jgi:hypothetical protein
MIEASNFHQETIKEYFKKHEYNKNIDAIFKIVDLLLYEGMRSTDAFYLYKMLGLKDFSRIINILDGKELKLPSKKDFEDNLLCALFYYEREINHLSWTDIKKKYPEIQIKSIKHAYKIKSLNSFIHNKIMEQLYKIEDKKDE